MAPQSVLDSAALSFYTDPTKVTKNVGINATNHSLDLISNSGTSATGAVDITNALSLQLAGSTSGSLVQQVPATTTAYTVTWPANAGTASQVLTNTGSGVLTWATVTPSAFTWLAAVAAATTANITLTGLQTIDGVAVTGSQRVLVKNQTTGTENGVYVPSAGAWTRATDLPAGAHAAGVAIPVSAGGTANGNTVWTCTNNAPTDVVGTDALTFVTFGSSTPASGSAGSIQYAGAGSIFSSASNTQFKYQDAASNVSATSTLTVGAVSGQGSATFQLVGATSSLASATGTAIQILSGAGGANGAGGAITLTSAAGTGTGLGGALSLTSGDGSGTSNSGAISLASGNGTGASSGAITIGSGVGTTVSGAVTLSTGAAGTAGTITIQPAAGTAAGSSAGGNLVLATTNASGSANAGSINITTGTGATGNGGNLVLTAGTSSAGVAGQISLVQNGITYNWPAAPTAPQVGQILKINTYVGSTATLSWAAASSGTPAGNNTEIQFNNAGAFGAASAISNGRTTFSYAVTPTANDAVLSVGGNSNSTGSPTFTLLGTDGQVAGLNGTTITIGCGTGNAAGNGGSLALNAGTGGASGAGGSITLAAGSSSTLGGGSVSISGANGGTTGGGLTFLGGSGGSGAGGAISLTSGASTSGNTGAITIQSASASSGSKKSGAITIATLAGGTGSTTTSGSGSISITTATSGATSSAGNITIVAGDGGATSGDGGDITIGCGLSPNGTDGQMSFKQNGITYLWPVASTGVPPTSSQVLSVSGYVGTTATLAWAAAGGSPAGVNGDIQINQGGVFSSAYVASTNLSTYNYSLTNNYAAILKVGATASSTAQQNSFTIQGQATTGAFPGTAVSVVSGAGTGSNAAGALTLSGGLGGATSAGGAVSVSGGAGGSSLGDGGAVSVTAGSATSSTTGGNGGALTMAAGAGTVSGNGGLASVTAGAGGPTGTGGAASLVAGAGGSTSGAGGAIALTAGAAVTGTGGSVSVTAGASTTSGAGGSITLTSGVATSGDGGNITLNAGNGTTSGGNVVLKAGTGTTAGTMTFRAGESASNVAFTFEGSTGTDVVNILAASQAATSQTTGTLRVSGGCGVTGDIYATSFNAVSDARYKKNIKRLSDPLQKIMAIEGYEYDWKDESLNNGKKQLGLLAQQLEEVGLSDVVTGNENKKAVNYSALIPLLVEAVKELAKLTTIETAYDE